MSETRVCTNPACEHHGAEQNIESFPFNGAYRRRICRDCRNKQISAWYKAHRTQELEGKRRIPDNDPETDLVPMVAGGFVRWAVLTWDRRSALGESSEFNGQSIDIEPEDVGE